MSKIPFIKLSTFIVSYKTAAMLPSSSLSSLPRHCNVISFCDYLYVRSVATSSYLIKEYNSKCYHIIVVCKQTIQLSVDVLLIICRVISNVLLSYILSNACFLSWFPFKTNCWDSTSQYWGVDSFKYGASILRSVYPVPRYTPKLIVTFLFIVIEDNNPTVKSTC